MNKHLSRLLVSARSHSQVGGARLWRSPAPARGYKKQPGLVRTCCGWSRRHSRAPGQNERNFEFVHSVIKRALANGELDREFDSRELAFGFYGQANAYLMAHLLLPGSRLNRQRAERIVDLFLAGAAPKKNRN